MSVLDASVLVAIALKEPERDAFVAVLVGGNALVGTPTLVETSIVLRSRIPTFAHAFMEGLIRTGMVVPEAFTIDMYPRRGRRLARFGKGTGHPARLNFGDCLSYAVARVKGLPLLYKGQDFAATGIRAAL